MTFDVSRDFDVANSNWLESEEARKMLLMIEDDIYREGNYLQRNFNFSGRDQYLMFYVSIFALIFLSILLGFSFLDGGWYVLVFIIGFFVSVFLTSLVCAWKFSTYLLFRSSIKKAVKKFGSTENFMAFLSAINIVHKLDPKDENYEKKLNVVKKNLNTVYNAVDSLYAGHSGLNVASAVKLAEEFQELFERVRYAKKNSLRAKNVENLFKRDNDQAKDAMLEYFKK